MEELKDKYRDRDVEFVAMYVREPHAGEVGFPEYEDHKSLDHKLELAAELQKIHRLTLTVGVDDMTQEQHARLGNLPNMAYVVDKNGTVAYSNTWQHAEDIDKTLAALVTADKPSKPILPTITTKHLGPSIS